MAAYGGRPGGFFPNDPTAETDSPSKRGPKPDHTLTPCTIRQVLNGAGQTQEIRVDGKDLGQVSVVGVAMNVTETTIHLSFILEDGTGRLQVKQTLDAPSGSGSHPVREGTYVRVVGSVKSWQGQPTLTAFKIIPVTDFNEITFHALDAIHVHLHNTKGPLTQAAPPAAAAMHDPHQSAQPGYGGGYGAPAAGGYGAPAGGMGYGAGAPAAAAYGGGGSSFTPLQQQVLNTIKAQSHLDSGAALDFVVRSLGTMASEGEIRRAIDQLLNECVIYTVKDSQHYKAIEE